MRGQGVGEFRQAGRSRTTGRPFHQRRAPKPRCRFDPDDRDGSAGKIVEAIRRTARHRSRLVSLYRSPAGAVYVLPDDLSVSHQQWARAHESWLVGWYSITVTADDLLAEL